MFRGTYCLPGHPTEYYPTANYWEVEVGEAKIMAARSAKEPEQITRDLSLLVLQLSRYAPEDRKQAAGDYLNPKGLTRPRRAAITQETRDE